MRKTELKEMIKEVILEINEATVSGKEPAIFALDRMNGAMIDFESDLVKLDHWQNSGSPGAAPKQNAKLIADVRSKQVQLQKAFNKLLKNLDTNLTGWGV